jgi:hypothetical protein
MGGAQASPVYRFSERKAVAVNCQLTVRRVDPVSVTDLTVTMDSAYLLRPTKPLTAPLDAADSLDGLEL